MRIFAISDPHFSSVSEKPMDIFGNHWKDHTQRIELNWRKKISDDDVVIVPGDISWGLKFDEVIPDLNLLHSLPGKKIIVKGNHDLWWSSPNKLNKLYDDIFFVQNNFCDLGDIAVCGTRGWMLPGISAEWTEHDEKIFRREILRLEFSLKAAADAGKRTIIAALHYPPADSRGRNSEFTKLVEKYNVKIVIYGHLHGCEAKKNAFNGHKNGVEYMLVSSDVMDFEPKFIYDGE